MTRHLIRAAAQTAVTAVTVTAALVLTACGAGTDGFHPHPREGGRSTAAPTSGAEDPDGPRGAVIVTESGPVTLTPEDTELVFGRPAAVATVDDNGHLLAWTLQVDSATVPDPGAVRLTGTEDGPGPAAGGINNFLCFPYSLTYVGADRSTRPNSTVVGGSADPASTVVTLPTLTPALETGLDTNEILGGASESCGIPGDDRLPTVEKDLVTGRTYRGAILGYQSFDTPERTPTVVRFDYDPGVPEASTDIAHPSSVFWGMA